MIENKKKTLQRKVARKIALMVWFVELIIILKKIEIVIKVILKQFPFFPSKNETTCT